MQPLPHLPLQLPVLTGAQPRQRFWFRSYVTFGVPAWPIWYLLARLAAVLLSPDNSRVGVAALPLPVWIGGWEESLTLQYCRQLLRSSTAYPASYCQPMSQLLASARCFWWPGPAPGFGLLRPGLQPLACNTWFGDPAAPAGAPPLAPWCWPSLLPTTTVYLLLATRGGSALHSTNWGT
jgi:hypothetical protein